MSDYAIAWRDEQIEFLRSNMRALAAHIDTLQHALDVAEARAERAEEALRILKEEIADAARA